MRVPLNRLAGVLPSAVWLIEEFADLAGIGSFAGVTGVEVRHEARANGGDGGGEKQLLPE